MFRVCLIFYTYDSRTSKSIGNNTHEKNATRHCAGPAYYRMPNRRLLFKTKPAAVAPKETITHHFFVSGIGQKKNCRDAAKICGGAENVVKTETQQTFVNGLPGFITLGIYTPLKRVCIAHNN